MGLEIFGFNLINMFVWCVDFDLSLLFAVIGRYRTIGVSLLLLFNNLFYLCHK